MKVLLVCLLLVIVGCSTSIQVGDKPKPVAKDYKIPTLTPTPTMRVPS